MSYQRRIYAFTFDSELSPIIVDTYHPMTSKLFRKIRSMVRTEVRRLNIDFKCCFWRVYAQDNTDLSHFVRYVKCGNDPNDYVGDFVPDYIGRYSRFIICPGDMYGDICCIWNGFPRGRDDSSCFHQIPIIKLESEV